MKSYFMLACRNIKNELLSAMDEARAKFPVLFIPADLHNVPEKLRVYLQGTIDSIENVDFILMPMGLCGNSSLGLVSKKASIVLPKCGDCIDLLISEDNLKTERPKYSFFLTENWLGEKSSVDTEYKYIIEKYGSKRAANIIDTMYHNYKYFSIMDTGTYSLESVRERIRPLALAANMEINEISCKYGVLRKMVRLEFDDNFIILQPGEVVTEKHFV